MSRRRLLNCWIVAIWLWFASWGGKSRRYLWSRLSYSFRGMVPHFGIAQGVGWRTLAVIEFVPIKAEFGTRRNLLVLFRGRFRVWRLRVEKVRYFDTEAEAIKFATGGNP